MQGLEDVKVLELGHLASAAYAAKLMADLGANVVKAEEPGGDQSRWRGPFPGGKADPEQSGLFLSLNTNKRSVTLDVAQEQDRLAQLVQWADILVHDYAPPRMAELGIDYPAFRALNPRLVMCSITPFGLTGPYKDYKAYDITVANAGGWAWLSPGASDYPDLPPLKAYGQQTGFQGGLAATVATLGAYYRALETGRGEHIDLSTQAYVSSFMEQSFVHYTYSERVASRLGKRLLYPWGIYECQDGLIFLVVAEEDQWERLVDLMGNPEWGSWEIFQGGIERAKNQDVLKMYLDEWFQQQKVHELFRMGQERRICFAPVQTMAQLAEDEHLRARGFFVDVEHPKAGKLTQLGAPYRLREPWWQVRRPAPQQGEHTAEVFAELPSPSRPPNPQSPTPNSRLPLAGVRVTDFTWVWAGPFGTMHLAHLGAEVIKIESNARVDITRRLPIYPKGMEAGVNRSGIFNEWSMGKKSLLLNVAKPKGMEIIKELIKQSDVVVDNFATGVMDNLGLSYDELKQIKPDIIVASISGFGHSGPRKKYMGYGPAMAPVSGLSSLSGYKGGSPQEVGISYGDPNSGIHAAAAVCAALVARKRTGQGQYIDVSLFDAVAALVSEGWMDYVMNGTQPERDGNHDPVMAPHNCFRCAGEDAWVSVACGSDEEWQALCQAMGEPQLASDLRFDTASDRKANEDELEKLLTAWTSQRDRWAVTQMLQEAGVAAFPALSASDLAEDKQLEARGAFARLPHPEVGSRLHMGIPWLLAESPNGVRAPAPLLGQHTDEIMRDVLGYAPEEIARLKEEKVLD